MSSMTYQLWVNNASLQLANSSDSAKLDARLILCHGLSISQSKLLSWPDTDIPEDANKHLNQLLQRRLDGQPMAYILGKAEFWGLSLAVTADVLVPRPDTETLVEISLEKLKDFSRSEISILDLGTGSGAIALALGSELPDARITAVDASEKALQIARQNAKALAIDNVSFYHSDWYAAIKPESRFDIIVSNPPYVAENDPHLENLTYEPDMALTAANNGMADIEQIIQQAPDYLCDGGFLLIEHGFEQGELVRKELRECGFDAVDTINDLASNERVTLGKLTSG